MSHVRILILISGNGSNAQNLIEKLNNRVIKEAVWKDGSIRDVLVKFICVVSDNPLAYGLTRATSLGVDSFVLNYKGFANRSEFDRSLASYIIGSEADLVLLAGFMKVLGPEFFKTLGNVVALNIHPSMLPLHKGLHGIRGSFLDGNEYGGVTVHFVNEELDGGEIVLQERCPKTTGDDLESYSSRVHALEYELYPKAVVKILREGLLWKR